MALVKRKITIQFTLGEGQFGEDGSDTVTIEGLRASVQIQKSGGQSYSYAHARLWGVPIDVINRLTVQNKLSYQEQRFNKMTVLAGDDEGGQSVCFSGTISEAWADFNDMPDVNFMVTAQTGLFESAKSVPPITQSGQVDVVTLISGIASQMTRQLQNNGVTAKLVNPYYSGSLLDQLSAITRDANINCDMDDAVIAIWPAGSSRNEQVPVISRDTGMVGYPMFTQNSVALSMLFNPGLSFGQRIKIESALTPANGMWDIVALTHNIESEMPGGEWFTRIECGLWGHVRPIVT